MSEEDRQRDWPALDLSEAERRVVIDAFVEVDGIGKPTAKRLVDELGVVTLAELLEAAHDGRVAALPGVTQRHIDTIRASTAKQLATREKTEPRRVPDPDTATLHAGILIGSTLGLFALPLLMVMLEAAVQHGGSTQTIVILVVALVALVAPVGYRCRQEYRENRRARRRRGAPPRPPWDHPLARTRPANLLLEALKDRLVLVLFVASIGVSLAMWSALPTLFAVGLLLVWLALAPDTRWFRRRVEHRHLERAAEQARDRRHEQLRYLEPEQREHHRELVATTSSLRDGPQAASLSLDVSQLDQLIDHHLWLMELENHYADRRDPVNATKLDVEIEMLQDERAAAGGAIDRALARRLDVLERRRRLHDQVAEKLEQIRQERQRIEDTMRLAAESMLSSASPGLADEVEQVLLDVRATEDVVLDFHVEEDALDEEIEVAVERASA